MSDIHEDRLGMTDEPKPLWKKENRGYRDKTATFGDATEVDEVMTAQLPFIDISRLSTSMELRAIPVLLRPSRAAAKNTWITDHQTWMFTAGHAPTKTERHA